MPFKSRSQERWAFATGQSFAKEWASKTDSKKLPDRVDGKEAVHKAAINHAKRGATNAR